MNLILQMEPAKNIYKPISIHFSYRLPEIIIRRFLDTLLQRKREKNIVLVSTAAPEARVSTSCISCIIGSITTTLT